MRTNIKQRVRTSKQGSGLIEVIVATAILSGALFTLAGVANIAFRMINYNLARTQAEFLAEEGLEAARVVRDQGWTSGGFSTTSEVAVFYPSFNATSSAWSLGTTSPGRIDGMFNRTLFVENAYRNASSDLVASTTAGATLDSNTKFLTSLVSWGGGADLKTEVRIETYITNLFSS